MARVLVSIFAGFSIVLGFVVVGRAILLGRTVVALGLGRRDRGGWGLVAKAKRLTGQ